jgi:hypothetical protein
MVWQTEFGSKTTGVAWQQNAFLDPMHGAAQVKEFMAALLIRKRATEHSTNAPPNSRCVLLKC